MAGSGAAFCGGFQRNGPTGGVAYGIPLKLRIVALRTPLIVPTFGTVTTSGPGATLPLSSPPLQPREIRPTQAIEKAPSEDRNFMGRHPKATPVAGDSPALNRSRPAAEALARSDKWRNAVEPWPEDCKVTVIAD